MLCYAVLRCVMLCYAVLCCVMLCYCFEVACVLQTKGEVLGRLRGVSVKMLMHHSRNSEQKQWDETLVLALSGMGRLLRAHLPLLVPMQAFPQVWPEA